MFAPTYFTPTYFTPTFFAEDVSGGGGTNPTIGRTGLRSFDPHFVRYIGSILLILSFKLISLGE